MVLPSGFRTFFFLDASRQICPEIGAIDRQPELYTRCQDREPKSLRWLFAAGALGRGKRWKSLSGFAIRSNSAQHRLVRSRRKAQGRDCTAGPRQRGGEAAEIGDLLAPLGGICTGAGFEVTLVAPPALMARTT